MDWLSSAAAAATAAAATAQAAATAAATAVQERLEDEKQGFLAEFQRCNAASAPSSEPAAAGTVGSETLDRIKRVGMTLLNPLADQDSVSAGVRAGLEASVVTMLPWEQPGLTPDVRAQMRLLSQDRAVFLAPPACLAELVPPFVFSLDTCVDVIREALSVDKHLERQRHALVPAVRGGRDLGPGILPRRTLHTARGAAPMGGALFPRSDTLFPRSGSASREIHNTRAPTTRLVV